MSGKYEPPKSYCYTVAVPTEKSNSWISNVGQVQPPTWKVPKPFAGHWLSLHPWVNTEVRRERESYKCIQPNPTQVALMVSEAVLCVFSARPTSSWSAGQHDFWLAADACAKNTFNLQKPSCVFNRQKLLGTLIALWFWVLRFNFFF